MKTVDRPTAPSDNRDSPGMLHVIRIRTTRAFADMAADALGEQGICVTAWHDEDRDCARLEEFFEDAEQARSRVEQIADILGVLGGEDAWEINVDTILNRDWTEHWKRFFHAERVTESVIVKPPWEVVTCRPGDLVIDIDPGMSFGTGLHATTRGCLNAIETLRATHPGASLVDVGCGSGILAIAAVKLGYSDVTAIDIDAQAVAAARRNAGVNGCADDITFLCCDVAELAPGRTFSVVIANILACTLEEHAARVASLLRDEPTARLVLSGILGEQGERVCRTYRDLGLERLRTATEGEWCTLIFQPAHAPTRGR